MLAKDEREAVAAIDRVGLPCVVKPVGMGQGIGVETDLRSTAEVATAARRALGLSDRPIRIENHVAGEDYRLMVTGNELLFAYRRRRAQVTGDGKATIRELISRENQRRAAIQDGPDAYLLPIVPDEGLERLLARQDGLAPDAVPPKGKRVDVVAQPNTMRGGTGEEVSTEVHPDNRALAIRASRLFRLDTIGVDLVTPDISRSWKEVPCAIVEVNRSPLLAGMGEVTLLQRTLFPNRFSGRIPMVAIVGSDEYRTRLGEMVGIAFAAHGMRAVKADFVDEPDPSDPVTGTPLPPAVETLLLDPEADAGLILCAPARVEQSGLPLCRCDLVLAERPEQFPWLAGAVPAVLGGETAAKKLERAITALARTYQDPAEGGPLPVLEPIAVGAPGEFRLRVWCARTMPRGWFWEQVGIARRDTDGLTSPHDLLSAVRALAHRELAARKLALPAAFTHGELPVHWLRVSFDATLALPRKQAEAARAALLAAVKRVNRIAATKIP